MWVHSLILFQVSISKWRYWFFQTALLVIKSLICKIYFYTSKVCSKHKKSNVETLHAWAKGNQLKITWREQKIQNFSNVKVAISCFARRCINPFKNHVCLNYNFTRVQEECHASGAHKIGWKKGYLSGFIEQEISIIILGCDKGTMTHQANRDKWESGKRVSGLLSCVRTRLWVPSYKSGPVSEWVYTSSTSHELQLPITHLQDKLHARGSAFDPKLESLL